MEKKDKLTVKEFKMWLEGILDMQAEDWVPDSRQWKRILGKIQEVSDNTNNENHAPIYPIQMFPIESSVKQTETNIQPKQFAPGGMVVHTPIQMNTTAPFMGESGNIPVKTPNVDTSNGQYTTAFE